MARKRPGITGGYGETRPPPPQGQPQGPGIGGGFGDDGISQSTSGGLAANTADRGPVTNEQLGYGGNDRGRLTADGQAVGRDDVESLGSTHRDPGPERQPGDLEGMSPVERWWQEQAASFAAGPEKQQMSRDVYERSFDPNERSYTEQLYGQGSGLGAYYDRVFQSGSERLANRFAHSGFASSAHADALGGFAADLFADRARREAEFRQQQARDADAGRMGRLGLARGWASDIDEGGRADERNRLDYLRSGTDAATAATSGLLNRHKLSFEMQMMLARALAELFASGTSAMSEQDLRLLMGETEGSLAEGKHGQSIAEDERDEARQGTADAARIAAGFI